MAFLMGPAAEYNSAHVQHFRIHGRVDVNGARSEQLLNPYFDAADGPRAKVRETWRARRSAERAEKQRRAEALRQRQIQIARENGGLILSGILDLPRQRETGPIDGCAKIYKGLTSGDGFMIFTCEKLLPEYPIKTHYTAMKGYRTELRKAGWTRVADASDTKDQLSYAKIDKLGCRQELRVSLWADRSMNEGQAAGSQREAYRQILFLSRFSGKACQAYYPVVEALARPHASDY